MVPSKAIVKVARKLFNRIYSYLNVVSLMSMLWHRDLSLLENKLSGREYYITVAALKSA